MSLMVTDDFLRFIEFVKNSKKHLAMKYLPAIIAVLLPSGWQKTRRYRSKASGWPSSLRGWIGCWGGGLRAERYASALLGSCFSWELILERNGGDALRRVMFESLVLN